MTNSEYDRVLASALATAQTPRAERGGEFTLQEYLDCMLLTTDRLRTAVRQNRLARTDDLFTRLMLFGAAPWFLWDNCERNPDCPLARFSWLRCADELVRFAEEVADRFN